MTISKTTGSQPAYRPATQPTTSASPPASRAAPRATDTFAARPLAAGGSTPPSARVHVTPINQNDPDGLSNGNDYGKTTPAFANGEGFCGPTALLMAARALGFHGAGSTAQNVVNLAVAGKYASGTGVPTANFAAMAAAAGMQVMEKGPKPLSSLLVQTPAGYDLDHDWLRAQLAAGRPVIINVDTNGAKAGGGHYELLVGYDTNPTPGSYTVVNPWDGKETPFTPKELYGQIAAGNQHAFAVAPK